MDNTAAKDFKRIWTGARSLGLDKETIHDLGEQIAGRSIYVQAKKGRSLTVLNRIERWKLIQDLSAKGAFKYRSGKRVASSEGKKGRTERGLGTDIITPKQQEFIEILFVKLASREPDFARPEYRRGFIRQVLGKDWPQKKWEAQKIIEALKSRERQSKGA